MNTFHGEEILADLNQAASDFGHQALTTAAVFSWEHEDRELHYSYAGHHPAYVYRKGDTEWCSLDLIEPLNAENLPLGTGKSYSYDRSAVKLDTGDMLFMFTDGVIDVRSSSGKRYGEDLLLESLNDSIDGSPKSIKDDLIARLRTFVSGEFTHDDMTFMVLRIS